MKKKHEIVQIYHPTLKRFLKIDRTRCVILKTKSTPGHYKKVKIINIFDEVDFMGVLIEWLCHEKIEHLFTAVDKNQLILHI